MRPNDVHQPGLFGRFSDNMPASLVGTSSRAAAERRFCRKVAADFRAFAQKLDIANAVPFLFCDSKQIIETLRQFLPNLIVRPKLLPEKGDGPLHQFEAKAADQTMQDGVRGGNRIGADYARHVRGTGYHAALPRIDVYGEPFFDPRKNKPGPKPPAAPPANSHKQADCPGDVVGSVKPAAPSELADDPQRL